MFGARCSFVELPYLCLSKVDEIWMFARAHTRQLPIASRGFTIPWALYSSVTYSQTALAMRTLQRYLGETRMEAGMRAYAERFRFHHPKEADFVAAMSQGAGEELSWFFQQALDSTRIADYQVLSADSRRHELAAGLWDCPRQKLAGGGVLGDPEDPVDPVRSRAFEQLFLESQQAACAPSQKKESAKGTSPPDGADRRELPSRLPKSEPYLYDNEAVVQRRGDFFFPVDILATFRDGGSERTTWSLAEQQAAPEVRIKTLRYYRRTSPLVRVEVDPEQKLLLDENRINNSASVEPQRRPVARLFFSLVGALQTLLDLVSV
jgi:hypothetical protein